MWPSPTSAARQLNCALPPEFFFVAPASSFQHHPDAGNVCYDSHQLNPSNAIGVIPLLTAAPCLPGAATDEELLNGRGRAAAMQLWQNQQAHQNTSPPSSAYLLKPMTLDHANLPGGRAAAAAAGGGRPSSSASTTTCEDCGNQAKKDCTHRRCRTCCKSRGYDCATHVKSTWVPAARRRERQLMGGSAATATAPGSSHSTSGNTKKPRLGGASQTTSHTSTSNNTPARSLETTSNPQDPSLKDTLPGQVRAPAVFKCVRVTAVDDGDDEYAYQALVRIGGHVFKGFLYDQGVEGREGLPNLSELHLGGGDGRSGSSSSPAVNLDHIYPGGGLVGGSSYVNPIN